MDPTLPLLLRLPIPFLNGFGQTDNVLPLEVLEELQRRASVRASGYKWKTDGAC